MDVLLTLPPDTTVRPGHTDPTTVADELESNRFVRIWRGLDPEGSEACTALGEPATLILLGDDYDGGHKAWVRWPDGRGRHRARAQGRAARTRGMDEEKKSGISIQTLVLSSLGAVAAAVIVPMIWERGTLIATAMTPVIVALTSEALRKPAEKITAVTPQIDAPQRDGRGRARPGAFDPLPPDERDRAPVLRDDDPFELRARAARCAITGGWRSRPARPRSWSPPSC